MASGGKPPYSNNRSKSVYCPVVVVVVNVVNVVVVHVVVHVVVVVGEIRGGRKMKNVPKQCKFFSILWHGSLDLVISYSLV